jgi:hypothetical protein
MTLDVADPSASHASSVVADGDTVYGSAGHIFVASSPWGVVTPTLEVTPVEETLVHEFDVSAPERADYKLSGKVRGVVRNQWSFSEDDGYLRVVTTAGSNESESFVSILADQGQILEQVGQVGGLGKGERVQAVRFIGKLGYVVTFRQTDPLYVVDVSDPRSPRVRGELKILGYSAYLHPVGDGLLLGVGIEASEEGRRQGLAVNLFDVSDPARPKVLQHRFLGGGYSETEYDHHAFLWWAPTGLAMVPITSSNDQGQYDFVGAIGLRARPTAIDEVGRVQHPTEGQEGATFSAVIFRSLVVGDHVYTVSSLGIMQSALSNLAQQAFVKF